MFLNIPFLASLNEDPRARLKNPIWLKSHFEEPVWTYNLGHQNNQTLDWRVKLSEGSYLTDTQHSILLESFKLYLSSSVNLESAHHTQQVSFSAARSIIDFLLINNERYKISTYGIAGLTSGNLIEMLDTLASNNSILESVYNWSQRLKVFCYEAAAASDPVHIYKALNSVPGIREITEEQQDNDTLGIPNEHVPLIRAALYINEYYRRTDLGLSPATVTLFKKIYPECLGRETLYSHSHSILCITHDTPTSTREFPSAPVTTGTSSRLTISRYYLYRNLVYQLGLLHRLRLPAPSHDTLKAANSYLAELSKSGRFKTLPSQVIFDSLRNAIELHLKHGNDIVRGFCNVVLASRIKKVAPKDLPEQDFINALGPELKNLGVTQLGLSSSRSVKVGDPAYFEKLRSNSGLIELVSIYIGSIQLVVGLLMARRNSELAKLNARKCLDETESWLLFMNAKSTRKLYGLRQTITRPIDPLAVQMIKSLIRMQKILKRIGYLNELGELFSTPSLKNGLNLTSEKSRINRNFDLFCDYFEIPLNSAGQRPYIRQHQLRRFFALLFFYSGNFHSLETLQWMLGHTDPQHIWNYITESTDGATLNSAKAQYIAEQIHGSSGNYTELSEFIKQRFGANTFNIIDTEELEHHIENLANEGLIEIEPEFFTGHDGKEFKIIVKFALEKT